MAVDLFESGFLSREEEPTGKDLFESGFLEQAEGSLGALKSGTKSTGDLLKSTYGVITGNEGIVRKSTESGLDQSNYTKEQQDFRKTLEGYGDPDGVMDAILNVGRAAWNNPTGAYHETLQQLPNSGVVMGSMLAGAGVGAFLGGPVGAAVGGIAGLFTGNVGIEIGAAGQELTQKGEYSTGKALRSGAIKGSVITGIDSVTMGTAGWLTGTAGRATTRAIERTLIDNGIDVADKVAVKALFDSKSPIARQAISAGMKAAEQANKGLKPLGRWAGATAGDIAGEGIGEYAGAAAAPDLDADLTGAVLESMLSVPQSVGEVAMSKKIYSKPINAVSDRIKAARDKRANSSLQQAKDAANAMLGIKTAPSTKMDPDKLDEIATDFADRIEAGEYGSNPEAYKALQDELGKPENIDVSTKINEILKSRATMGEVPGSPSLPLSLPEASPGTFSETQEAVPNEQKALQAEELKKQIRALQSGEQTGFKKQLIAKKEAELNTLNANLVADRQVKNQAVLNNMEPENVGFGDEIIARQEEDKAWDQDQKKVEDQRRVQEVVTLRGKIEQIKADVKEGKIKALPAGRQIKEIEARIDRLGPVDIVSDQMKKNQAKLDQKDINAPDVPAITRKTDNVSMALKFMLDDVVSTETSGTKSVAAYLDDRVDRPYSNTEESEWFNASSPEWFKELTRRAKESGVTISRNDLKTIVGQHLNGGKLTGIQNSKLKLLTEVANDEILGKHPDFIEAQNIQELSGKGYQILGGQPVSVGSLGLGDKFYGSVPGREKSDDYTVVELKQNGEVVLQDGIQKTVDVFDDVNVLAMLKARQKESPSGNILTNENESGTIESTVEIPSILERFELEQQERLAKRKKGDRRVSIVNPHAVTGMMEGKYANRRLAELGSEISRKHNVPVVYVEGDLYNLGGLNAELGNSGADVPFKDMSAIVNEEFGKLGTEVAGTTKGGDEFGFTIIGATKEQVNEAIGRIKERTTKYVKDNNLEGVPHTKKGKRPGTGVSLVAKEFSPEYDKAAEKHRREKGIKDGKEFTAVDAWIRHADIELESVKYEGGFSDEYGKQTGTAGAVTPEGQAGSTEAGASTDGSIVTEEEKPKAPEEVTPSALPPTPAAVPSVQTVTETSTQAAPATTTPEGQYYYARKVKVWYHGDSKENWTPHKGAWLAPTEETARYWGGENVTAWVVSGDMQGSLEKSISNPSAIIYHNAVGPEGNDASQPSIEIKSVKDITPATIKVTPAPPAKSPAVVKESFTTEASKAKAPAGKPAENLKEYGLDDIQEQAEYYKKNEGNFRRWFRSSKTVDAKGAPIVLYSGHGNIAMYGRKYNPKRGTAGGFYSSESPEVGSGYALGKFGVKEYYENGDEYRLAGKNGKLTKKIWQYELTDTQKEKINELRKIDAELGREDGERFHLNDMDRYIKEMSQYGGEVMRWKYSGGSNNLFNIFKFYEMMGYNIAYNKTDDEGKLSVVERYQQNDFEDLLDELGIKWNSMQRPQPGVMPIYVRIENPIDASKPFPEDLLKALKDKAKKERYKDEGDSHWTKGYPLKQWVKDIESGDEYWSTQIPSKAIPIIKSFGYDGIKERGLKGSTDDSDRQINWIAFDPEQIKSVFNTGEYGETDDMLLQKDSDASDIATEAWNREAKAVLVHGATKRPIILSNKEFNGILDRMKPNRQKSGRVVRAFYDPKTDQVYINKDHAKKDTIFHEYTHPVVNQIRKIKPLLYRMGTGLVKGTTYHAKAIENGYGDKALDEALVQAIGEKGAAIQDVFKRNQFKAWLNKLFMQAKIMFKKVFGVDLTLDEFVSNVAYGMREGRYQGKAGKGKPQFMAEGQKPEDVLISRKDGGTAASISPLKKSDMDYRSKYPAVRGGWTKEKIRRSLKLAESGGVLNFYFEIMKFDSPEELSENLFYHGSGRGIGKLKPSITMSEREAETFGGGGYGQRYWGISLSKDRNTASNFSGQSRYGSVAPVLLKKGAVVISMPSIEDAVEIEDIIEDLWNRGIDAVKIGDWSTEYSEQEIVVLNPRAITVGESNSFPVFNKERQPSFDKEKIDDLFYTALDKYNEKIGPIRERRREDYIKKYGREPGSSVRESVKRIIERFSGIVSNRATGGTAASVGEDSRYLALARDPVENREELQRMVDEAAKAAGFTVEAWHGKRGEWDFTVFDTSKQGGVHFGNVEQAEMRGKKGSARSFFLKMDSTARLKDRGDFKKIPVGRDSAIYLNRYEGISLETVKSIPGSVLDKMTDSQFRRAVPESADSYMVKNAWQIKSADPVTYYAKDDPAVISGEKQAGDVVGLDDRFKTDRTGDEAWKNDDIRFQQEAEEQGIDLELAAKAEAEVSKIMARIQKSTKRDRITVSKDKTVQLATDYVELRKMMRDERQDISDTIKAYKTLVKKMPDAVQAKALAGITKLTFARTPETRKKYLDAAVSQAEKYLVNHLRMSLKYDLLKQVKKVFKAPDNKTAKKSNISPEGQANIAFIHNKILGKIRNTEQAINAIESLMADEKRLNEEMPDPADNIATKAWEQRVSDIHDKMYLINTFGAYNDMSIGDLVKAREEVDRIVTEGRSRWTAQEMARKQMVEEEKAVLASEITGEEEPTPESLAETKSRQTEERKSITYNILSKLSRFDNIHQSWVFLMDKISKKGKGGTLQTETVKRAGGLAHHATNKENTLNAVVTGMITKKFEEVTGLRKGKLKRWIDDLSDVEKAKEYKIQTKRGEELRDETIPLTPMEAAYWWSVRKRALALAADGNKSIMSRIENMGVTEAFISEVEGNVPPELLTLAAWLSNTVGEHVWQTVNPVHEARFGASLSHGQNYVPFVADYRKTATDDNLLQQYEKNPSMVKGALHELSKTQMGIRPVNLLSVWVDHVYDMNHFAAWAVPVQTMESIFKSPDIRNYIEREHGTDMVTSIDLFIDHFKKGQKKRRELLGAFDIIRSRFSTAVLGANPTIYFKQLTAIPAMAMNIPTKQFAYGITDFMRHPREAINVLKQSEFVQARYGKGFTRDIVIANAKTIGQTISGTESLPNQMMKMIQLGDMQSIFVGGWAVYRYYNKKYLSEGMASEQAAREAIMRFEEAAKQTQQSGEIMDLSLIQQAGPTEKLMTMFFTAPASFYRIMGAAVRNAKKSPKESAKLLALFGVVVPAVFETISSLPLLTGSDGDDDDYDLFIRRLIRSVVMSPIDGMFVARDALNYIYNQAFLKEESWMPLSYSPVSEPINRVGALARELAKWEDADYGKMIESIIDISGYITGYPTPAVQNYIQGLQDIKEGDTDNPVATAVGYGKYSRND